jgi:MinD-like ATPase involved in chromosome partitioning or flagellar assembly
MSDEQTAEQPAWFVTFYSFKGGVGRSMALINTASYVASRGYRVLVIDLDLEAPGISYLNPDSSDGLLSDPTQANHSNKPGFVDLLCDAKERGEKSDLFQLTPEILTQRYTRSYTLPKAIGDLNDDPPSLTGSLRIMSAGKFDGHYTERFNSLNLQELYQKRLGEPLIRFFKTKLAGANLYDYVFVDSRTGFSDEAGICTRDLADYLMILTGLNSQNVKGTCAFLKALRQTTHGQKEFRIILSPIPQRDSALLTKRRVTAKAAFEAAWDNEMPKFLEIPYHPTLALTEEPSIFSGLVGVSEAYRKIENHILKVRPRIRRNFVSKTKHEGFLGWLRKRFKLQK